GDASPDRSAAGSERWSSGPVGSPSVRWPESPAATASPPPARQSHVRCQFPRNSRPAAIGSKCPVLSRGDLSGSHRSPDTYLLQNCQNRVLPTACSDARRTDDPLAWPTPTSESKDPRCVVALAGCPLPSTNCTVNQSRGN